MDLISKLTEIFRRFPGIGPRQAKRFVYHLLTQSASDRKELAELITELSGLVKTCSRCFRFYTSNEKAKSIRECPICADPHRARESLMVVSRDVDFENIEKSGGFNGLYFILGGSVPILEKEPMKRIRIRELIERLRAETDEPVREVILALNLTPEGENTQEYVLREIAAELKDKAPKLSVLGRGLSTGLELEYSDADTIKNALKNRY
jgi:recombination protein RecR